MKSTTYSILRSVLRITLISFAAGRRHRLVYFRRRKLRLRRLRRWSFKIGKRRYRVPKLRRRLLLYFRRKWVRLKFRGRRRYIFYGRTWRPVRKIGRYWRVRISRRWNIIRRFTLKVKFNRRRVKIVRRRRKWRVYVKRKWRRLGCRIRRYVRYKGKRRWLKRRKGIWRLRLRRKWRRISRPIRGRLNPQSFSSFSHKRKVLLWAEVLIDCLFIILYFNF